MGKKKWSNSWKWLVSLIGSAKLRGFFSVYICVTWKSLATLFLGWFTSFISFQVRVYQHPKGTTNSLLSKLFDISMDWQLEGWVCLAEAVVDDAELHLSWLPWTSNFSLPFLMLVWTDVVFLNIISFIFDCGDNLHALLIFDDWSWLEVAPQRWNCIGMLLKSNLFWGEHSFAEPWGYLGPGYHQSSAI